MTSNSYSDNFLLDRDILLPTLYGTDLREKEAHTDMHLGNIDTNNWPLASMEQGDWTVKYGTKPEQTTAMIGSLAHDWNLSETSKGFASYGIVSCYFHLLQTNSFGWGHISMTP
jgi:hypothetical protein